MKHIHLKSCESTQNELSNRFSNDHILISTENQTSGRGRGTNKWDVFSGSLCFSFSIKASQIKTLSSLEVGVLVCDFFKQNFNKAIQLKWPNDLIYKNKKVGGILINTLSNNWLNVGIGINLSKSQEEFFGDYKVKAITLFTSKNINKQSIAFKIYHYILDNRLASSSIHKRWNLLCAHIDKRVEIYDTNIHQEGVFLGINDDGSAQIQTKQSIINIYSGSLNFF
ncbi:MAG: biotin--[acetyl-CoA-carboxylase] ligase [Bacteriovoracaceae bacterium]|jgi:BirA family biotin operon repressor/biotin-[acetyl-CoA-carboxylase] ligase|nr:biotin--[acetyl-CoA-carboxylase] ligase [Bacteriovoracaceae bacterium]